MRTEAHDVNCQCRGTGVPELTGGRPRSDWRLRCHSTSARTKQRSADPWADFASSNPVLLSEILAAPGGSMAPTRELVSELGHRSLTICDIAVNPLDTLLTASMAFSG